MTNHASSASSLLAALSWRYATKKFDPAKKIDEGTWKALEQAMVLSASSYGLQPWRFYVIQDPAMRQRLRAVSWNQPQITDASHMVLFARKNEVTEADVDRYVDRVVEVRKIPRDVLKDYRGMMVGSVTNPATLPGGDMVTWTRSQTYIALGQFLASAAVLGVDACPMEGFDAAAYNQILGLPQQGYSACVVAAAGYRAADDMFASMAKVRFKHEDVVKHL